MIMPLVEKFTETTPIFLFFCIRRQEGVGSHCNCKHVHHVAEKPDHALDEHSQTKTDFHPFAGFGLGVQEMSRGGGVGFGRTVPILRCAAFEKFHRTESIPQKSERKLNPFTLNHSEAQL